MVTRRGLEHVQIKEVFETSLSVVSCEDEAHKVMNMEEALYLLSSPNLAANAQEERKENERLLAQLQNQLAREQKLNQQTNLELEQVKSKLQEVSEREKKLSVIVQNQKDEIKKEEAVRATETSPESPIRASQDAELLTPSSSPAKAPPKDVSIARKLYSPEQKSSSSGFLDSTSSCSTHTSHSTPKISSKEVYVSRGSANGSTVETGPKGGKYYVNNSGNKVYVDKSKVATVPSSSSSSSSYGSSYGSSSCTSSRSSSSSRTIHTGPRGGRYYINSNGNKTYVKRK